MITIDLSDLPATHQWGIANAVRKANAPLIAKNAEITARNEGKPEEEQEELLELHTVQGYANDMVNALFERYWQQTRQDGLQEQIIPRLMTLELQEEFELRAQFEIPNLIPNELLAQLPQ